MRVIIKKANDNIINNCSLFILLTVHCSNCSSSQLFTVPLFQLFTYSICSLLRGRRFRTYVTMEINMFISLYTNEGQS